MTKISREMKDALQENAALRQRVSELESQAEQRYNMLFEEMLDGFALHEIICDEQGRPRDYRFLDVNPAFEKLTGLSRATLLGKTVLEVMPNTEPEWIETYGEVALSGAHRQFESYSRELGRTFRVTAFSPQRGQFVAMIEDISARKQAEQDLRANEEKFRAVLEQFSDGFALVNEHGRIEEWNRAMEELTGVAREAALGKFSWDVQWQLMPARQRSKWSLAAIEATMRDLLNGVPMGPERYDMDVTFGDEPETARTARQSISVINTMRGLKLGILLHDISAQKKAEAALQESEERYRSLVEFSPYAVAVYSGGRLVYANLAGARLAGVPDVEDLLNRPILELVHPSMRELISKPVMQILNQNQAVVQVEGQYVRLDGSKLDVEMTALPYTDQGKTAAQIIVQDITERKQVERVQTFLAQYGWLASGEDFFDALARYLALTLEMDYVCIDRLDGGGLTASTLSVFFDGSFDNNLTYALKDTPCSQVVGQTICVFPSGVRHLFPLDSVLQDMLAESYLGATLWGSSGQPIGLIAVIGRQPLKNPRLAESLLKLVSLRAAGELERRYTEEALRVSEERYRQLVELSPNAVFVEIQGRVAFANAAYVRLLGAQNPGQILGRSQLDFVHPEFHEIVLKRMSELARGMDNPPIEEKFMRLDGSLIDVEVSAVAMPFLGEPATQVIAHDISERKLAERSMQRAHTDLQAHLTQIESLQDQLHEQAIRDYLTGLFNRRYLQATLVREIARATRENFPVGLVMMDVDHFKQVNDTHGHRAGDLLLETWGELLRKNIRVEDIACRFGGEEFVIVMPGAGLEVARQRAETLREMCDALRVPFEGHELRMTISLGLAVFPLHAQNDDGLLMRADRALYRAKRAGRNRVSVYRE